MKRGPALTAGCIAIFLLAGCVGAGPTGTDPTPTPTTEPAVTFPHTTENNHTVEQPTEADYTVEYSEFVCGTTEVPDDPRNHSGCYMIPNESGLEPTQKTVRLNGTNRANTSESVTEG